MEGKMKLGFALRNVAILGRNLYVGAPEHYSTIGTEEIVTYAAKAAGVTQASMLQTFLALYDAFEYYLCNGHSFKLDGLGTFSLSLSAVASDPTAANVVSGADAVTGLGVNFLPVKSVKSLIADIAWETVVKASSLSEFTDFVGRKITIGSDSINILTPDPSEAHAQKVGDKIVLVGWNCPDTAALKVEGKDASGADVSEEFTLNISAKKTRLEMVASAKATKAIAQITKVTIDGTEYVYTGTSDTILVKAGNTSLVDGSSIEAGTYELVVTGKDLSSLVLGLDGVTIEFTSKTSTKATGNITLEVGTHQLTVNEETRTIVATEDAVANVMALTANGVTVTNGGTSGMLKGSTYAMVATGSNLNLLSASDIKVPTGSTVSDFTVSSDGTRLQFNVVYGGTTGTIYVGEHFYVNITTTSEASGTVTTVGGVATGGTIAGTEDTEIEVVGTNLDNLTFGATNTATGKTTSSVVFDASAATISASYAGNYNICFYNADGDTVYTATLTIESSY